MNEAREKAYDEMRIVTDTRTWRAVDWHRAGFDAGRTFTAEDIERAHDAAIKSSRSGHTSLDTIRAALGAVGVVQDA